MTNDVTEEDNISLRNMMLDTVTLVKKDGTKHEDIQASVQTGKIFIADGSVPLEEADRLVRALPNGMEESFIVEDRGYYTRHGDIPEHYQAIVRREGRTPRAAGSVLYQAVAAEYSGDTILNF